MVPSWSLVVGADRGSVQVSRKLPSRQDVASSTLVSRSIPVSKPIAGRHARRDVSLVAPVPCPRCGDGFDLPSDLRLAMRQTATCLASSADSANWCGTT
jgi:hypothetical protein